MGLKNIIGRESEISFLQSIWASKEAEFLAVYGRRRVGKTYLIREFFSEKKHYFELTGTKEGHITDQLKNFTKQFQKTFNIEHELLPPDSWESAFERLTDQIKKVPRHEKMVIFLDELPWLATKRSKLIQCLDYAWNTAWSKYPNLILIVCGSAASWMLDHLINAKGGLYNRLTQTLLLQPFDLGQTKAFLRSRHIKLSNRQILDLYMVTGGIPHYLKQVKKTKSVVENINEVCFRPDGLLFSEFNRLFASLFGQSEIYVRIIREIAKCRYGISMKEISKKVVRKSGGTLSKKIDELESAGFIHKFLPNGRKRGFYYKIIDEYAFFYLSWIEPYQQQGVLDPKSNYWQFASQSAAWHSWSGYTFENICLKHIGKIRQALGVDKIHCCMNNWRHFPKEGDGTQIDLVIERVDGATNLCEIKYYQKPIVVDKLLARALMRKMDVYEQQTQSGHQIFLTMITVAGVKQNAWSRELLDSSVVLDDLF